MKEVANNLLQEHKLELSPSSPCDDDLIATVTAIFGAITNSYSESDKHVLARKLIKNLWKTHLEKLGLISPKLSSQPQSVNTTSGVLTIGVPKMPGTAKKEKRASPSRTMPSSPATSIFFASLPTREAQELTSTTLSHAATIPLSAIAEVNSATSLSSSSATTVTLSEAKTDTQESQDDFTEQSEAIDLLTVPSFIHVLEETEQLKAKIAKPIIQRIENDLQTKYRNEEAKILEQLVREMQGLTEALETGSDEGIISSALFSHFKAKLSRDVAQEIDCTIVIMPIKEIILMQQYYPDAFKHIASASIHAI